MIQICKGNYAAWGYHLETQVATDGHDMFLIISIFETEFQPYLIGVTSASLSTLLEDNVKRKKGGGVTAFLFEGDLISAVCGLFLKFIKDKDLEIEGVYLDEKGEPKMTLNELNMEGCYD